MSGSERGRLSLPIGKYFLTEPSAACDYIGVYVCYRQLGRPSRSGEEEKRHNVELADFAHAYPKAALGFSGGVDSSYLLYAGLRAGADWLPVYVRSVFQPAFELADAQRLCRDLGTELTVLDVDILSVPQVRSNPADRCYYCKRALFGRLSDWAASRGISLLLDGNNASDPPTDRPGMRAAAELGVRSPLREAGLTKADIRRLSREAGLFTWDKPAYACLATRIPAGTPLDEGTLDRVERGEAQLREMGYSDLRIRVFHGAARIQLPGDQMAAAVQARERIVSALKPLFDPVLLDLEGRPGGSQECAVKGEKG